MYDQYDSILIGGSGFVGTRLGAYLVEHGERVLNLSRGQSHIPMSGLDFARVDFNNREEMIRFVLPRTKALIVLIGQTGPGFDPDSDRRALERIVDLANRQIEPMKVLYCSSALVYGDCEVPARESDSLQPVEFYAKHKAENETFLRSSLANHHHLGILRLSNVFGDIRSRGFISLIMNRLLSKSPEIFYVNGDGGQERDYVYVEDLVEAIAAVKSGLRGQDTINVATGESRTLLSVIDTIQLVCGRKLHFEITHQSVVEAEKIKISNERLREIYGYVPRHTFVEGLTLMWGQALIKKEVTHIP